MKPLVAIITILAVLLFGYTLIRALYFVPTSSYAPTTTPIRIGGGNEALPMRLLIPAIGVNAKVQRVGVTASGAMGVPNNFTDVAWYKYGTVPGNTGSAVIDGHVDNGLALPGVFKHLSDVAVGDEVDVETASSTQVRFVVDEIERYPMDAVPLTYVFARSDAARLVLITCTGAWVPKGRTYDTRLVVYAHRVS